MRRRFKLLRAVLILAALVGTAGACAAEPRECPGPALDLQRLLAGGKTGLAHYWGGGNISLLAKEDGTEGPVLRVAYPAASFSPGSSPILGGAGFEFAAPTGTALCLSYKLRFPHEFDFVKGGKLPGLFGGDAPRGCQAPGDADGFSARLMWRAGGAGELYLYAPRRKTRCGESIGRGSWRFERGAWTSVMQRIGWGKGRAGADLIELWIDGRLVVQAEADLLAAPAASPAGLLFATFFGGGDAGWATPSDQFADFADLRLVTGP